MSPSSHALLIHLVLIYFRSPNVHGLQGDLVKVLSIHKNERHCFFYQSIVCCISFPLLGGLVILVLTCSFTLGHSIVLVHSLVLIHILILSGVFCLFLEDDFETICFRSLLSPSVRN